MAGLLRGWLLSLVFVTAPYSMGEELAPARLKEAAQKAIKNESSPPAKPRLSVTDAEVALELGGAEISAAKRTPLAYALEEQVVIELFREFPPKSDQKVDWAPVLAAAQEIVNHQIQTAVDKSLEPSIRENALKNGRERFEGLFENALKPLAGKREVVVVRFKGSGRYTVKVKTDPGNGTAYYLTEIEYELLKAAGQRELDDDQNWYEVATTEIHISGSYIFRGRWGKKTRTTGVIRVTKDDTITIRRG